MSLHSHKIRPALMMLCLLPLTMLAFSGCPGPGDPVANCATCAECNPNTVFPAATVPLPQNQSHKLFPAGAAQYGCIGVRWEGLKDDPPAFVAKLNADGSYEVLNPSTRLFTTDPVVATVAPGVGEIDVLFFVFKTAKEEDALKLNCTNTVQGGVDSCWSNADCLFAWKVAKTTAAGTGGSCQLCRREICDNKDNDCDGKVDEDGACGRIFNDINCDSHPEATVADSVPGCNPQGACACKVTTTQKIFVCAGEKGKAKWTPIESVTALCSAATINNQVGHFCGGQELICDSCPAQPIAFRFVEGGGCSGGVLKP